MRDLNGVFTQCFERRHDLVACLFLGCLQAMRVSRKTDLPALDRCLGNSAVVTRLVATVGVGLSSSRLAQVVRVPTPSLPDSDDLHGHALSRTAMEESDARPASALYQRLVLDADGSDLRWYILQQQVFEGAEGFVGRTLEACLVEGVRSGDVSRQPWQWPASLLGLLILRGECGESMWAAWRDSR